MIKKAKDREELEQVGGELSLDITIMAKEFRVNELVSSWKERRVQELADEKKAEEEERQRAKEEIIAKEIKDLWDYLENTPVPNRDLTPLLVRIGCISIEGDEITGIDGKRYDSCDFDFSSISETLAAHKGRDLVHDVFRNVIRNMKQDVVSLVDRRKKALKFVDS